MKTYIMRIFFLLFIGYLLGSLIATIGQPRKCIDTELVWSVYDVTSVAFFLSVLAGLTHLATREHYKNANNL